MSTTDTTPTKTIPEPVCPLGDDFTELVTIAEIGIVSRQLGCNPIIEIETQGQRQWEAMARLGWVLDRRRDRQAAHSTWDALTLPELMTALGIPMGATPADTEARRELERQADEVDPTAPAPA